MTATKPGPELIDPTGTTSGHVLTSTGGSTAPTFQAGAGGWSFVSAFTASGGATVDFTGLASGYDYQLCAYGVQPSGTTPAPYMLYGTGGTPTYQTSSYAYSSDGNNNGTQQQDESVSASFIELTSDGVLLSEFCAFIFTVLNPADSGNYTECFWKLLRERSSNIGNYDGAGRRKVNEAVTAIRFKFSSGNVTVGEFKLYRRANA
jgi:hypothetical protein